MAPSGTADKSAAASHIDLSLEINDKLQGNEILLTFAGYRTVKSLVQPKSIYVTYQFYTCASTRTEVMRLGPGDPGEIHALIREGAVDRLEATLAIRHLIDCSLSSPQELEDFSTYLSHSWLYVDVWDADALVYIGTTAIPMRRLMRQGEPMVRFSLECDVINTEIYADYSNGIVSTTVYDAEGVGGTLVGSLQVVLSNTGFGGKGIRVKLQNDRNVEQDVMTVRRDDHDGLNWRANVPMLNADSKVRRRPRNVVRARPLSETTPELSGALSSLRTATDEGGRSLTRLRGGETDHSLSYDEVVMLFKRFQGPVKGTVQYRGPLLSLLDVPTWSAGYRRLMEAYHVMDAEGVKIERVHISHSSHVLHLKDIQEISKYVDGEGKLSAANLKEFLRHLFDRAGVKFKPDEIMVIVRKFINGDKDEIHNQEFIEFCREDFERHEWNITAKRLRRLGEKAELLGMDLGQKLSEHDAEDSGYLTVYSFRSFLEEVSQLAKMTSKDIDRCIRYFAQRPSGDQDRNPISCIKVMAFFGKEYGGNPLRRLQALLRDDAHSLQNAFDSHVSAIKGYLSFESIEELLGHFRVYDTFSRAQIRGILGNADTKQKGKLTAAEFFNLLQLPYKPTTPPSDAKRLGMTKLNTEDLMRILIDRCKAKGSSVSETFRHFDSDGDGYITYSELEEGLDKLGIFDNISDWRNQLPAIAAKIDTTHNGLISLHDFFKFLGDVSYAPNIIQKMTKIFALATQKGMTFDTIFTTIDQNKSGMISVEELHKGLIDLGTFHDLKITDVMELITHLDQDKDNKISSQEFVEFFKNRVEASLQERVKKNAEQIVIKFRNFMAKVVDKGGKVEDIFKYFDQNNSGFASSREISEGLKKLPNFKELSDSEIGILASHMGTDQRGKMSLSDFRRFIRLPGEDSPKESKSLAQDELQDFKQDSKSEAKADRMSKAEYSPKELLIRHMRRISMIDGGIANLLAYLDDDEDGLITQTSLMKLLRKEDAFETVSEKDVEKILEPMLHHGKINVAALLRFLEGKENKENNKNHQVADEEDGDVKEMETVDEYAYSKEPETRALEKKLRGFGGFLAKRGLDVEQLFARYDPLNNGWIRRTDFINTLSEMGLFILEKGKVVDEAAAEEGADPHKRIQLRQLNKLKGTYIDRAERVARKFVFEGNRDAKDVEFRVIILSNSCLLV